MLNKETHNFGQKYDLLMSEKRVVEEVLSKLEVKVYSLTQSNEVLMIQNESLESNVVD